MRASPGVRRISHFSVRARGAPATGPTEYATCVKILK
jgi:hypothetical protein